MDYATEESVTITRTILLQAIQNCSQAKLTNPGNNEHQLYWQGQQDAYLSIINHLI